MNKSDYDKYYKKGGTYIIPVELFNELFDELERQTSNYEQALEDLDKKENIIKEVREKLNTQLAFTSSYQLNYQSAMSIIEEAKSILDKENKQ